MMEPPLKRVLVTDGVILKGQEEGKLGQTQLSVLNICSPKGMQCPTVYPSPTILIHPSASQPP